jgi:hypothetical protein
MARTLSLSDFVEVREIRRTHPDQAISVPICTRINNLPSDPIRI